MSDPRDYDHEVWGPVRRSYLVDFAKKWLIGAGTVAGSVLAILALWKTLDGPVPAMQGWVQNLVAPLQSASVRQLRIERRVIFNELFLWESNTTKDANIRFNIDRLKSEIAEIDRQISTHR